MLNPREVEAIGKHLAEYKAVTTGGELEAEYKRLSGLIAEWDKRQNLGKLTSDLTAAKTALIAEKDAFTKSVAASEQKFKQWEVDLKKREDALVARTNTHNIAADQLSAKQATFDSTAAATKKAFDAQSAMLEKKAKDLENLQGSLHQRGIALSQREDKVKEVFATINTWMKG